MRITGSPSLDLERLSQRVRAVVLYGSAARGDDDQASDIDIVVFVESTSPSELRDALRSASAAIRDRRVTLAVYPTVSAETMVRAGSLFMWHLFREGFTLLSHGNWLEETYTKLQPYTKSRAKTDLATLNTIRHDILASVEQGDGTILFDAATLFTVLRNTSIVTSSIVQDPIFGRLAAIEWMRGRMRDEFPLTVDEVSLLSTARLVYNGKSNSYVDVSRQQCIAYARATGAVIAYAQEQAS